MYVDKQNESRVRLAVWEGDPESIVRTVSEESQEEFPLLFGIGLYEDTYFNTRQLPMVIKELLKLKSKLAEPKHRTEIDSLIEFMDGDMGEYVRFVGD